MTKTPIISLPVGSPIGAPALDSDNITDFNGDAPLEYGAKAHWLFGNTAGGNEGSASLTSRISSHAMTLNGNAPTYNTGYLQTDTNGQHGLLLPFAETQTFTMCIVLQLPAGIQIIATTTNNTDGFDNGGHFFYQDNNNMQVRDSGFESGSTETIHTDIQGSFFFIGLAYNLAGLKRTIRVRGAGAGSNNGYTEETAGSLTLTSPTPANLGIGSTHYVSGAFDDGAEQFAELIYWDRYLNADQMEEVYKRSKRRMTNRGVTLTDT